jgi:citrate/tricarballylate utilization protein
LQRLESLAREASDLAAGAPAHNSPLSASEAEVGRVLQICNACRYCEGFCATFQAMIRRLEFRRDDIRYLANLCHNCAACYHACQYTPPNAFAVNVPQAMARVRAETYACYAWPGALGGLYRRNGLTLALATAAGLALTLLLARSLNTPSGNFYAVFPHGLMVALFGAAFGFAVLALAVGARRFWNDVAADPVSGAAAIEATRNALVLKYLDGGHGEGCNEADDRFTLARRIFHHYTFYGFLLCFAATCVATIYHFVLRQPAPYPLASLPVLLGTAGGVGLLIGPAGLLYLDAHRHPDPVAPEQNAMDRGFAALLFLSALSGLALLAWRHTQAMAPLLAIHLGLVLSLFLTLPYGKFAHAVYRSAALLKWSSERRQPSRLQSGSE